MTPPAGHAAGSHCLRKKPIAFVGVYSRLKPASDVDRTNCSTSSCEFDRRLRHIGFASIRQCTLTRDSMNKAAKQGGLTIRELHARSIKT